MNSRSLAGSVMSRPTVSDLRRYRADPAYDHRSRADHKCPTDGSMNLHRWHHMVSGLVTNSGICRSSF